MDFSTILHNTNSLRLVFLLNRILFAVSNTFKPIERSIKDDKGQTPTIVPHFWSHTSSQLWYDLNPNCKKCCLHFMNHAAVVIPKILNVPNRIELTMALSCKYFQNESSNNSMSSTLDQEIHWKTCPLKMWFLMPK